MSMSVFARILPNAGAPSAGRTLLTLALSALTFLSITPAQAQQVVPAGSEIAFTATQIGVPMEGKFTRWSAQVSLDPRKPEAGRVSLSIQTGSATLGSAEADAELPKPEWFGVAKFPAATFESKSIKALGGGRFEVQGTLSIKGQSQPVTVPVAVTQTGSGAALQSTAQGQFKIRRLAFKIGEGGWSDTSMVADDVTVRFKLQLTGLKPL